MNIKQTIITTAVALTTVALIAPASVGALTTAELQAQINILMSQLAQLQGQTTVSGNVPAACVGVSFTRNLTVGSTGNDVRCLQVLLNMSASTKVSVSGAGSPGSESTYFGAKTLAAVRIYQANSGFTPANQVGPMTRAKLNAWLGSFGSNPNPNPNPVPMGAGLTVMLASNNPAGGTVVDTQGLAPLAMFTFVNGDNAEVKVTSLKVKRVGISADATLTNVYLFDGARRLTDSASVSSTMINFNDTAGIFTVPAGGSKTISVVSDIDGAVGETVGVQIVSMTDVSTNASSVKGSFPVSGNMYTIAAGTSLATAYMSDASGNVTPAAASIDPQNDYAIWYDNMIVGTRAVWLQRMAFRVGGSVSRQSDVKNYRLLVDGVQVGSTVAMSDANDYITFDLTGNPVKLETGTRQIKVLADIIGGSNKNVYLSLRTAADVTVVDSQVNVALSLKRGDTTTTFTAEDSGTQSINSGTLTVTKMTTSPSGNVVDAANNVLLAKYEFKAAGEKVKVESLRVSATVSDGSVGKLRNGAVYANGVQIGSTTDIQEDSSSPAYTTFNFGSSLIVEPGSPVTVEVRADMYDSDGTNNIGNADTIKINIVGGDLNNAYGMVSFSTVDVPSSTVSGNTVTVSQGGVVLSKYTAYTNQNAVAPLTDFKLAHFTLTASTTEAVNINTIYVYFNYASGNISNFYVKFGNNTTAVKASPTSGTSRSADSWAVNYTLAAGQTVDVMVFGTVNSSAAGVAHTGVYVTGTTASSAQAVTAGTVDDETTGQTITFTSGSWASALDAGTPLASSVAGGQTVTAAKYKLTASNDSYTVKEARFTVANAATSAVINSLTLSDGTSSVTVPYDSTNSYFNITGMNMLVPANTSKTITATLNLATPYTNGTTVTTGKNVALTMSYLKIADSQGTESTPSTSVGGNYVYVFKSIPTFTVGTIGSQGANLAAGGTVNLYNFTVGADSKGPIALKQLKFAATVTDAGTSTTPSLNTLKFFRGSDDITTSVTILNQYGQSLESTGANVSGSATPIYVVFDTEEQIAAGTTSTFTLKATATGFAASSTGNDSVSVSMSSDSTPAGVSAGAAHARYYLDATSTTAIQTLNTSAAGAGTGTDAVVIWSDNSAQSHDYTYTGSSSDWFNGYLIKNLPLDAMGTVVP